MDIRKLKYFVEVAKHCSFTKASESLFISQSTLSKAVLSLEEELGVQLLDRSNKRLKLTESGEILLKKSQLILQSINNLYTSFNDIKNLKEGNVKIGSPPIIGALFLPKIISKFKTLHPGIRLETVEKLTKDIFIDVEYGELDLGIVLPPINSEKYNHYPFLHEKMMLIVNSQHRLAKMKHVPLKELVDETFILFKEGFFLHEYFRKVCITSGFEPIVSYTTSHWDFIYEMVEYNVGVSVMPDSLCKRHHYKNVKSIPISNPTIPFNLSVITKKDSYISFAAKEVIKHLLNSTKSN